MFETLNSSAPVIGPERYYANCCGCEIKAKRISELHNELIELKILMGKQQILTGNETTLPWLPSSSSTPGLRRDEWSTVLITNRQSGANANRHVSSPPFILPTTNRFLPLEDEDATPASTTVPTAPTPIVPPQPGPPAVSTAPAGLPAGSTAPAGPPTGSTAPAGPPAGSTAPAGPPAVSAASAGPPALSTPPVGPSVVSTDPAGPPVVSTAPAGPSTVSSALAGSPTILVVGSSIVRDVSLPRSAGPSGTLCFPGAGVEDIHRRLPGILDKHHDLHTLILHVGGNDVMKRESEVLKTKFLDLFASLWDSGLNVVVSGPLPTRGRGHEKWSRIYALHCWLESYCIATGLEYVNNFDLFSRPFLLKADGLHPNEAGALQLSHNLGKSLNK